MVKTEHRPELIIIAGPNGSGKTSVTKKFLHHEWAEGTIYINPDEVAKVHFGDWNSREAIISAANYCADWRERCLAEKKSFVFETVMSADETEQIINDCVTQYPNAILRGSATRDYNCHSYAWYSQSLENNYWINYITQSGIYQLSKYWTSDLYESCSESEAEKIYYSDGDHSAIKLSNGNYLSKWGQGPLMEHSPTYCPYIQTNMEYYRIRTSPIPGSISVNGPTSVEVNQSNYYSVQNYNSNFTYTWEVRFMDAPSPTPFVLNANNSTCTLICQDYGYFKTSIYGYYQGRCVAHGQIGVIAMP